MTAVRWAGKPAPDPTYRDPPGGDVVERRILEPHQGGVTLCAVTVSWSRSRLAIPRARAWEAVLGPFRFAGPAQEPGDPGRAAAVRAALREIVWGSHPWHAITVLPEPGESDVLDTAWRYGTQLGLRCVIESVRPSRREEDGRVEVGRYGAHLYSRSPKALLLAARRAVPAVVEQGRALGAAATARLRARRRRRPVGIDTRYFVLRLDRLPAPVAWPQGLRLRDVEEAEIARDPLCYGMSLDQVERALQRGDHCLVGFVDGELAHHRWWSTDRRHIETLIPSARLEWPVVFAYDGFTHPRFRGRGIQPASLRWVADQAAAGGARQVVVRVHVDNAASQRGIAKAGFVPLVRDA